MQYAQLAYDTYMRTQGDVYIPFDELNSQQQACWEAVAEAVSDATRGWIATRISGPITRE